ncbi:MAG: cytochrome c biogenesis protein ResB [Bacteroidales bacterium]
MSEKSERKIWQAAWGYPESLVIVIGVIVIGFLLQLCVGAFDFYIIASPVNYIVGVAILFISILLGAFAKSNHIVRFFSSLSLSVTQILAILLLSIIMGLIPQLGDGGDAKSALGFELMTRNWGFVLLYTFMVITLGAIVVRRLIAFSIKDLSFYLNHIGLWLLLVASALGAADMERYIMYVNEGDTQWRVYADNGAVKELPIAIELKDFDMDVYPPKLAIINRESGKTMPEDKPQFFQIDSDDICGEIFGWDIELEDYIHNAVRSSDSTYHEVPMPGATPAAMIKISKGGEVKQGWICGGNQSQLYMTLPLDDNYCVVMTTPEPRTFKSDITVYAQSGQQRSSILEVNKPLRIDSWYIYQYGYDNNAGRLSSYSSFELVYDPWIVPVYIGIILIMIGALLMLWNGAKSGGVKL